MAISVIEEIKSIDALPSPTGVALEIMRLADDPDTTVDDIAKTLETDPATVGRLLRIVNSPLAGLSRRIASVPQAIALLGLDTVRNVALGFAIMNQKPRQCAEFDHERFCSESIARAVAARHVAAKARCFAADEAFGFGLLCQVGRLALAAVFSERYARVLRAADHGDSRDLARVEWDAFETEHNELGADLLTDWNLPTFYCDAVRYQDTYDDADIEPDSRTYKLARLLHFTGPVSTLMLCRSPVREEMSHVIEEATTFGIEESSVEDMFDSIRAEWEHFCAILA
ncbi:MAG: HDOD domain-containing protein [Phycisphaerae bacterium]